MATKRIGDFLSQVVALSGHDIEEILQEQSAAPTRKSFGDIALSMGLCRPEDVWKAWCVQLIDGPPRKIDLDRVGIDTQAIAHIDSETAHALRAMPVRVLGDFLIVAICADNIALAAAQLPSRVAKQLRFALADPAAIRRALAMHYPVMQEI